MDYDSYEITVSDTELLDKHDEFIRELNTIMNVQRENREQCLQDRRFATISSAQWEGDLQDQYANKPRFEINKVHLSLIRIFNEYRHNRITVDFVSRDGSKADDLADFCDGLYRACEYDSNAQEAYDNAFEEATSGGIGAWRYTTKYYDDEDPEDDRQTICIEPIYDADSCVFFDLSAKRQDKADARRCYVLEAMTPEDFEAEYDYEPESQSMPTSVGKLVDSSDFDWVTEHAVYVAEVYEKEESTEEIYIWKVGGKELRLEEEKHKEDRSYLKAIGGTFKKRKIKRTRVHKYIISGDSVLEDCGVIAGDQIPIVISFGKRWVIDNVERCMGHVRLAKDAQRLKNMQISNLAEISSFSTFEKPIFIPEQILGHAEMWGNDNIENYNYLLINPVMDASGNMLPAGPVGVKSPPAIPPALAALLQITEDDIQDLLGNQQDGEQVSGNISTETAMLVQNRIDMQTYIYMSNFARAMQHGGRVWLGMAKEVFTEKGREVKTINAQKEVDQKVIAQEKLGMNSIPYVANDLSRAKMDVRSSVGPSSATAKQSLINNLNNMLTVAADPETQQVLTSAILMNMEGEGLKDIKKYFRRKLIRMGVVTPTQSESQELAKEAQGQQPSPQDQYFMAEAERARAAAVESQADVILKQAKADETRAKTAEIMADIDAQKQTQAFEAMEKMGPSVNPPAVTGSPVYEGY